MCMYFTCKVVMRAVPLWLVAQMFISGGREQQESYSVVI